MKQLGHYSGLRWAQTHQASVDAILGPGVRPISSRGSRFYNRDAWTQRAFMASLCEWAKLNPGLRPDMSTVQNWVRMANAAHVHDPEIVIATTPESLPRGTAMALVGGAYHEAWHTRYSRRTRLKLSDVFPKILDYWDLIPAEKWAGLTGFLLTWDNIIDDIRIERRGCEEFPGALEKMEALQDLILRQEGKEEDVSSGHRSRGSSGTSSVMSVIIGAFRDIGLGYDTPLQNLSLRNYAKSNPPAYRMVAEGSLRPLLDRAIALPAAPDLGGMWLAMEVVAAVLHLAESPPKKQQSSGGSGEGEAGGSCAQPGSPTEGEPKKDAGKKPRVFKVGDRAKIKKTGQVIEVTWAGVPHPETGEQELRWQKAPVS